MRSYVVEHSGPLLIKVAVEGDESGILKGAQRLISDEIPISTPLTRSSQLGSGQGVCHSHVLVAAGSRAYLCGAHFLAISVFPTGSSLACI